MDNNPSGITPEMVYRLLTDAFSKVVKPLKEKTDDNLKDRSSQWIEALSTEFELYFQSLGSNVAVFRKTSPSVVSHI